MESVKVLDRSNISQGQVADWKKLLNTKLQWEKPSQQQQEQARRVFSQILGADKKALENAIVHDIW